MDSAWVEAKDDEKKWEMKDSLAVSITVRRIP